MKSLPSTGRAQARVGLVVIAPVLLSLACGGCVEADCRRQEDIEPVIELGTGTSEFEELGEDTRLQLSYGPQGGAHFWAAIRFEGFVAGYGAPSGPAASPSEGGGPGVTGHSRPSLELSLVSDDEELDDFERTIGFYGPHEVQPQGDVVLGVTMFANAELWDDSGYLEPEDQQWWEQSRQAIAAQPLRYTGTFTDVCGTTASAETTARVSF